MSKFGFGMNDLVNGIGFYQLSEMTVLLKGRINRTDSMKLKSWILSIKNDAIEDAVLIIDNVGGYSDPSILTELIQVPVHVHICGEAHSFAALLFLCGSAKTMSPDAIFMLHESRWEENKEADLVAYDKKILYRHRYKVASIVSTVAPGRAKHEMVKAVSGPIDTYFPNKFMWDTGVVDAIVDYTGEALGLDGADAIWYNKKYGKQDKE